MATAHAATPDEEGAVCSASLVIHTVTPVGPVPATGVPFAGNLDMTCIGVGDEQGTWGMSLIGVLTIASCEEVAGSAGIATGNTSLDGGILGGNIGFAQVGPYVLVEGQIDTTLDAQPHRLVGLLAMDLTEVNCLTAPTTTLHYGGALTLADSPV
jgi:hypothetical protein